MIQIVLQNVEVQVGDAGPAAKMLNFVDKVSGITVSVPMDRLSAINIGRLLVGGGKLEARDALVLANGGN